MLTFLSIIYFSNALIVMILMSSNEQMNRADDNNHLKGQLTKLYEKNDTDTVVTQQWWIDDMSNEVILTLGPPVSASVREYLAALSLYEEISSE